MLLRSYEFLKLRFSLPRSSSWWRSRWRSLRASWKSLQQGFYQFVWIVQISTVPRSEQKLTFEYAYNEYEAKNMKPKIRLRMLYLVTWFHCLRTLNKIAWDWLVRSRSTVRFFTRTSRDVFCWIRRRRWTFWNDSARSTRTKSAGRVERHEKESSRSWSQFKCRAHIHAVSRLLIKVN